MTIATVKLLYQYTTPKIRKLIFLMLRSSMSRIQMAITHIYDDDDDGTIMLVDKVKNRLGEYRITTTKFNIEDVEDRIPSPLPEIEY